MEAIIAVVIGMTVLHQQPTAVQYVLVVPITAKLVFHRHCVHPADSSVHPEFPDIISIQHHHHHQK